MFRSLSESLQQALRTFSGTGTLTQENIQPVLDEIQNSLLEGDVALEVVDQFVERIRSQAIGQKVDLHLRPEQKLVRIVQDELTSILGGETTRLNLAVKAPAVILVAGLQGVGKTTTTAKLANYLIRELKKRVLTTSLDFRRPGALDQLRLLSSQVGAGFYAAPNQKESPTAALRLASQAALEQLSDVLLVDTAGRLAVDTAMMGEVREIHSLAKPAETLFVVDAMTGQDAAFSARAFAEALPLTGVILTKVDGDSRGGAALSVSSITGCPIKFMGTGEQTTNLEPFHPERIASRILGMGDILSLVEEAESRGSATQARRLAKKIKKGRKFDLYDFRNQLRQMEKMGGVESMMEKLPQFNSPSGASARSAFQSDNTRRMEAIINSMTPRERRQPELIAGSRKRRVAAGSGTEIRDVNSLLKQYKTMQKMAKKMKSSSQMKKLSRQLASFQGMNPFNRHSPRH